MLIWLFYIWKFNSDAEQSLVTENSLKQKTDCYIRRPTIATKRWDRHFIRCPVNIYMRSMPSYVTVCLSAQVTMPTELNYQGFVNMNVLKIRCFLCEALLYLMKLLNPFILLPLLNLPSINNISKPTLPLLAQNRSYVL